MASPEHRGGQGPEQEPVPYYRAARFGSERTSAAAYHPAQELIRESDVDLSVFRFQLDRVYHVAVIGAEPDQEVQEKLEAILSQGEQITLSRELLRILQERRARFSKPGSWWEGHYGEGRRI